MIRSLTGLLDEWMPIVAGREINDDPYAPGLPARPRPRRPRRATTRPIDWVHRDERFGEKLATPDTSIADLIGEVDPIKVAEGRYLSDELTLHYGLVPRTNRGIFAINELPDLAERIQVGLLNVLEERDVQIRGYKVRLPLDLLLFASANPEDYTNRGRIITPLKDRFGSQIRTHYPLDVDDRDRRSSRRRPGPLEADGVTVVVPDVHGRDRRRAVAARPPSPHINQRSGVSVRLIGRQPRDAGGQRRPPRAAPRRDATSCPASATSRRCAASTAGKVEIETSRRAATSRSSSTSCKAAVLTVFREHVRRPRTSARSSTRSRSGLVVHAGEDVTSADYVDLLAERAGAPRAAC